MDNKNSKAQKPNILVSELQLTNPLIKAFMFNYSVTKDKEYDFKINENIHCFYLSLRYFLSYPEYIKERFEKSNAESKYLFCHYDTPQKEDENNFESNIGIRLCLNFLNKNSENDNIFEMLTMKNSQEIKKREKEFLDLNLLCFEMGVNLIVGFSFKEIAQFIHSLSLVSLNKTTRKLPNEITNNEILTSLSYIDKINKNDATSLFKTFNNIKSICLADNNKLKEAPKINKEKVEEIDCFLNYDFKLM